MTNRISKFAVPRLRRLQWVGAVAPARVGVACRYLSTASPDSSTNVASASKSFAGLKIPIDQVPSLQPPSARQPAKRQSQMIRTYTSLLRSTPLMLLFQHNNLTAVEWAAVRRELKKALENVTAPGAEVPELASRIQVQVLSTNMFRVALKITEFYDPTAAASRADTPKSAHGPLVHDLSESAYESLRHMDVPAESTFAQMEPLVMGPLAALIMPTLSTAHLAAALSVLSPVPGQFPAPTRRKNPGYYDPACQEGLSKLLLVGGRIEGKVFDQAGVNWVGGIEGGLDGLRSQLVGLLQGAGLGVTSTLEAGSRSLWLALEGRKEQLEGDGAAPPKDAEGSQ
ncbi:hypothetical protein S40293_07679 [Stachybotrys chartarum IBT 40293]|nr:hypothetical protein S40293_07679 [Stachybotrys chartarum IBT 40293]